MQGSYFPRPMADVQVVRKPTVGDVESIYALIESYASRGEMLRRPLEEIYHFLRDYILVEEGGEVVGVCALHIYDNSLGEIRSLAVKEGMKGRGIGTALVEKALDEAKRLGISRVFTLTYIPEFFERFGFHRIDKTLLPQKIWRDCITCRKLPECDEIALIKEL